MTENIAPVVRLTYFEGHLDAPVCPCGNDVTFEGFTSLDANNEPIKSDAVDRYVRLMCNACGKVYTDRHIKSNDEMVPVVSESFKRNHVGYLGMGEPTGVVFAGVDLDRRIGADF